MKKRILLVFGTRPEAIKMAPLVKELEKHSEKFETLVCVTGQHREMLDRVLELFEIKPQYDLDIMKAGQDLYDVTSRVLLGMREVLQEAQPDFVLVHGDTATSTTAALAAFYLQIPVGHIEAGLRTNNIYSPWPEEMNRQLTGRLASCHFAPTVLSKHNLLSEGVDEWNIYVTGNTVIDALQWVIKKFKEDAGLELRVVRKLLAFGLPADKIKAWSNRQRKLVLITGHRRENFGQGVINICEAIKELALQYDDVDFVYPMHLNPKVREAVTEVFGGNIDNGVEESNLFVDRNNNTYLIEPLDYLPFMLLMYRSYLVLTDSGGIQEEAPSLGKPVLVMRNTTERPEAVEAGTVRLIGTDKSVIIKEVSSLILNKNVYEEMSKANNPYGDGMACGRVVGVLSEIMNE
ncbi:MAG: non-hydrolyzing UDP-N-acetylglucosamine 2-epimerase [Bacteroidales bacterium]